MTRRKPLKRMSDKRAEQIQLYSKLKRAFLREHPRCAKCNGKAEDLHHTRGRASSLFTDVRHFLAVCRKCHEWIHRNRDAAIQLGLRSTVKLWNTPDRTI